MAINSGVCLLSSWWLLKLLVEKMSVESYLKLETSEVWLITSHITNISYLYIPSRRATVLNVAVTRTVIPQVYHMYSTCIGFQTMHVEVIVPNFRFCYNLAASSVPNCILITFVSTHTLHASLTLGSKHEWWSFCGRKCTASVAMCVWSSVYESCAVWFQ